MTDHRAKTLGTLLPIALATGHSEVDPDLQPLKVRSVTYESESPREYLTERLELGYRPHRRRGRY
jgi:hypothetical protein